ncbi:hypothetical protein [Streptomyces sp. HUCO-GS316]|uniref:hypothetical protein n=1 Tax=Streptomyces sp. HUCO-GS316 TaxID=2692198 RepID=UPI001926E64A
MLEAKRTGKKVTVTDETTATSTTVANPNGTLTTHVTPGRSASGVPGHGTGRTPPLSVPLMVG